MRNYPNVGVQIADILLPKKGTDLTKWAVIACDQFTSQPEYWKAVAEKVGEAPSTYHMILPEVYLGTPEEKARLKTTQAKMREYIENGTLETHEGLIYVERTVDGKTRRGLMLALDLERYDFNKGSKSLIRATEGTILDRLPPRIKIREGAEVELPHIIVLVDDPEDKLLGSIEKQKASLPLAYDFELMQNSGHLSARFIADRTLEEKIIATIEELARPDVFEKKYGVSATEGILLFAVGDGNHSLATAKSIWEMLKPKVGMDHPSRYALVEIENVHDHGLEFEPIHRVLFNIKGDPIAQLRQYFGANVSIAVTNNKNEMIQAVKASKNKGHTFGLISCKTYMVITVKNPNSNLPVGTLQAFLDDWMKTGNVGQIDYVHGDDVVCELGSQCGNAGFYLAGMPKSDLFKTVILDGALPRKTFSMGEAHEKRFYMECRKIVK